MGRRRQDDCRCAPPNPTLVPVLRNAYKEPIADYAGLATVAWSTGNTGYKRPFLTFPTDIPNSNFNCIYYKEAKLPWLTTDLRVFPPIRYRFSAGLTNYDHAGPHYRTRVDFGITQISQAATHSIGGAYGEIGFNSEMTVCGVSTKLLSTGSNVEFWSGYGIPRLTNPNIGMTAQYHCVRNLANPASDYLLTGEDGMVFGIKAIQHRVNGSPVGPTIVDPGGWTVNNTNWHVNLDEEDEYEIDVWFYIKPWKTIPGWGPSLSIPQTVLVVGQLSNTENNSLRRLLNHSLTDYRFDLLDGAEAYLSIYNVNCTKFFDQTLHTYEITLNGQPWTWDINGSVTNGPRKLDLGTEFSYCSISKTGIYAEPRKITSPIHVNSIGIDWGGEIPVVSIQPGPAMLSAMGYPTSPAANVMLQYRIDDNSHYRTSASTNNADMPAIVFHPQGKWTSQGGTTTFNLVNHTTELTVFGRPAGRELRRTGGTPGAIPSGMPTSVTLTRVNR